MTNEVEIFGADPNSSVTKMRHGKHITVNLKSGSNYLSRELVGQLFGEGQTSGRCCLVHSKIEGNWYIAKAGGSLFNTGFDCNAADKTKESVFRINGAAKAFKKMVDTMDPGTTDVKFMVLVSSDAVEYEGMKLYKLTLKKEE